MGKPRQHSDAKKKTEVIGPSPYSESTYSNAYGDPNPVPPDISQEDFEVHKKSLISFGDEMYKAFVGVNKEGELLWMDFISTFRPHSIEAWPKVLTYKWCAFLR